MSKTTFKKNKNKEFVQEYAYVEDYIIDLNDKSSKEKNKDLDSHQIVIIQIL